LTVVLPGRMEDRYKVRRCAPKIGHVFRRL
jgi:hypothetical protein